MESNRQSCVGWAILFIILTSHGFAATPNLGIQPRNPLFQQMIERNGMNTSPSEYVLL
jgi:hypothetical protein